MCKHCVCMYVWEVFCNVDAAVALWAAASKTRIMSWRCPLSGSSCGIMRPSYIFDPAINKYLCSLLKVAFGLVWRSFPCKMRSYSVGYGGNLDAATLLYCIHNRNTFLKFGLLPLKMQEPLLLFPLKKTKTVQSI